jgi:hypothetical protein
MLARLVARYDRSLAARLLPLGSSNMADRTRALRLLVESMFDHSARVSAVVLLLSILCFGHSARATASACHQ